MCSPCFDNNAHQKQPYHTCSVRCCCCAVLCCVQCCIVYLLVRTCKICVFDGVCVCMHLFIYRTFTLQTDRLHTFYSIFQSNGAQCSACSHVRTIHMCRTRINGREGEKKRKIKWCRSLWWVCLYRLIRNF